MLIKTLENIGLTQKEAKVYLAALEIGSSPVSHIATKAKINRVTTYDILEKLSKKGLISSFTRAKVKFFTATEPEVVVDDFKRRVGNFEESLPEFKKLNGEAVHTAVKYFEGIDGIRNIYEDALKSESEIRNFGNIKDIKLAWPTYEDDFIKKRIEKEIPLKAITLDDEQGRMIQAMDKESHRETRLLPPELFNFSNEIFIYGNKVAIISFGEMVGMIIESPEIAKMQLTIFNLVWSYAQMKSPLSEEKEITQIPVEQEAEPTPEVEVTTTPDADSTTDDTTTAPDVETTTTPEVEATTDNTETAPDVDTTTDDTTTAPEVEPQTTQHNDNYLDPVPNLEEFESREHGLLSDKEQDDYEQEKNKKTNFTAEQIAPSTFTNEDQIKMF